MADPIDMLELAKRLIPDIETGMPEDVAKAFGEGKIKSIFRTSDAPGLRLFGETGNTGMIGGRIDAGSTYFLNEDGGIARYGRHGLGWGDSRLTGEGTGVARSSFLDEAIFTKKSINHSTATAKSIDEGIASGVYSNKPSIGLGLFEFDRDAAGELIPDKKHSGHWVSDIYHSSGEAEFTPHLNTGTTPPRNSSLDVVKTNISDINFETQTNSYGRTGIPRLKTPSSGVPLTTSPPPSPASGPSLDAIKNAAPDTVTSAGKGRPMVAANYSKMSDEDLLKHYEEVKKQYAEQLIKDPDGKAFMPTARRNLEGTEKQLRARGIHPDDISSSKIKAKVTSEDVVSKPVDEPVAKEHSPRKIAALEEMAENGTVHEKEIAKRKLEEIKNTQNRVRGSGLNIGTPTDDIRTRPTPKGTDAASRSVVDSGGTRPIINVEPPKPDTIKPPVDKPADVSAKITTDSTTPVKNVPDTSSRITKITSTGRKIKDNGMDVAKNISSGNARTMGIAAIAGLLGAGAYGLNKKKEEDIQSRVNKQRYGEM
jgi:hypothetical protein